MRPMIHLTCIVALGVSWMAPVASLAGTTAPTTDKLAVPAAGKLGVADVKAMLDRKEPVFVFDANERESYLAGHIPGAQWVAYDAVSASSLPRSRDARLVFYCYNPQCGASPLAAKTALGLGYHNVWLMPEGITGWRHAHLPVVAGAAPR